MINKKYLMKNQEKKEVIAGFVFWNFAITLGMIVSSISSLVNAGISIASAASPNSDKKINSYRPNFNFTQPYFRLSKYPSKTNIGFRTI
ncbi:MAG: hypothetical protein RSA40_00660 [Malacoplasma sp.]